MRVKCEVMNFFFNEVVFVSLLKRFLFTTLLYFIYFSLSFSAFSCIFSCFTKYLNKSFLFFFGGGEEGPNKISNLSFFFKLYFIMSRRLR